MQEIHSVSIGFITAASGRSSGGRRMKERFLPLPGSRIERDGTKNV